MLRTMPASRRGLRHRQLVRGGVEIGARGRGDPGGPVAERHDVQIAGEDLVLGQRPLHLQRDLRLFQLARRGLLGGLEPLGLGLRRDVEEIVLDVLLGQRGRTLHHITGRGVGHQRPDRALPVHPVVLIETPILDRHDRGLHRRRDVIRRDHLTVLVRLEKPGDRDTRRIRHRGRQRQRTIHHIGRHRGHRVARIIGHQTRPDHSRERDTRHQHTPHQAQTKQESDRPAESTAGRHNLAAYVGKVKPG